MISAAEYYIKTIHNVQNLEVICALKQKKLMLNLSIYMFRCNKRELSNIFIYWFLTEWSLTFESQILYLKSVEYIQALPLQKMSNWDSYLMTEYEDFLVTASKESFYYFFPQIYTKKKMVTGVNFIFFFLKGSIIFLVHRSAKVKPGPL